ncbi:MAG: hypothetical protein LKF79_05925 [Solobacterium sp.]|nr:hypothetical protein [Solobacterium sp.]MCH4222983.1 hypothetical protein [Solobacterium sp.]MCH4266163.1 hypothetical protein [Solobacterium sp.]
MGSWKAEVLAAVIILRDISRLVMEKPVSNAITNMESYQMLEDINQTVEELNRKLCDHYPHYTENNDVFFVMKDGCPFRITGHDWTAYTDFGKVLIVESGDYKGMPITAWEDSCIYRITDYEKIDDLLAELLDDMGS